MPHGQFYESAEAIRKSCAASKALSALEQCARYFDKEDDQLLVIAVDDAILDLRKTIEEVI